MAAHISVYSTGVVNVTGSGSANVFPTEFLKLVSWGNTDNGGDSSAVSINTNVSQIRSSTEAFAILDNSNKVIAWGDTQFGGDFSDNTQTGNGDLTSDLNDVSFPVTNLYNTNFSFAALRTDGRAYSWGHISQGGGSSSNNIWGGDIVSGIVKIVPANGAFVGLKGTQGNYSLVAWGNASYNFTSSARYNNTQYPGGIAAELTSGIYDAVGDKVFPDGGFKHDYGVYNGSFVALKGSVGDHNVVSWGNQTDGGNSDASVCSGGDVTNGVVSVTPSSSAWAAIKSDGSVVTWGNAANGGSLTSPSDVTANLNGTINVTSIVANVTAFAAIRTDGSVICWGNAANGGNIQSPIATGTDLDGTISVVSISASERAFAALRSDGSVITWGSSTYGGNSSTLYGGGALTNVNKITASYRSFGVLRNDGSVDTWGNTDANFPLAIRYNNTQYPGGITTLLASGVTDLFASGNSYAAVKTDEVISWGNLTDGGDSFGVNFAGVTTLYPADEAFAAITYN